MQTTTASTAMATLPKEVEALIWVLPEAKAIEYLNLSKRTWDRLKADGDTPIKTQISEGRVGYRVADIVKWLEARQVVRVDATPAE
jgi:predicted DNA-binding transcriptional regulator AlpA